MWDCLGVFVFWFGVVLFDVWFFFGVGVVIGCWVLLFDGVIGFEIYISFFFIVVSCGFGDSFFLRGDGRLGIVLVVLSGERIV